MTWYEGTTGGENIETYSHIIKAGWYYALTSAM